MRIHRSEDGPTFFSGPCLVNPGPAILRGVVCHINFGSQSRSDTTSTTATDQAQILAGNATGISPGDFSDVKNTEINLNVGKSSVGDVNISTTDPEIVAAALSELGDVSNKFTGSVSDIVQQANTAAISQNKAVLEKLTELSTAKLTDGESTRDKTILYVIFLIAAAGVAVFYFWKRR